MLKIGDLHGWYSPRLFYRDGVRYVIGAEDVDGLGSFGDYRKPLFPDYGVFYGGLNVKPIGRRTSCFKVGRALSFDLLNDSRPSLFQFLCRSLLFVVVVHASFSFSRF